MPGSPRTLPPVVILVFLLAIATTRVAVADDFFSSLSPLLSPVINSICSTVVCGKGNCSASPGLPGYKCVCEPGWTQLHASDDLGFLPCIIPNCTIDHKCSNNTSAPAPPPLPPKDFSPSLDPCSLAYCGTGGTCKNGSGLGYHCECQEGFGNLLNITTLPCYQNCSIGADCASIGLFPNSSQSPAPPGSSSLSNNGNAASLGSVSPQTLLPLLILVSLIVVQAI